MYVNVFLWWGIKSWELDWDIPKIAKLLSLANVYVLFEVWARWREIVCSVLFALFFGIVLYNLAWFKTYEFIYGASPAAGCAARAREHLTRARARCASNDKRARETREQIETRAREVREQGQDARACSRARPSDARAQISSPRAQISSPNRK